MAPQDALLQEATEWAQRWSGTCQQLRASHEATMTQGLAAHDSAAHAD
jgi:hypothetical protein